MSPLPMVWHEEQRVHVKLRHAVRGALGDRVGDRRRGELHVGDVDAQAFAPLAHLGRHPFEIRVGFGPAAAVIHDEQSARHRYSAGPQ